MTSAEEALLAKIRRGEPVYPIDHVPTITDLDELQAFMDGLKANGRMDDATREACLRRQRQLIGTAAR